MTRSNKQLSPSRSAARGGMSRQGPDADERVAAKTHQFGIAVTTSNFHAPLRPLWKNDLEQHI
jgi:hypothetical protein